MGMQTTTSQQFAAVAIARLVLRAEQAIIGAIIIIPEENKLP